MTKNPKQKPDDHNPKTTTTLEKWLLVINAILAGVGIFSASIYYGQLETSKKQMTYSLRAWVGFGDRPTFNQISGPSGVKVGSVFSFTVPVKNYGQTPGGQAENGVSVKYICGAFPSEPSYQIGSSDMGVISHPSFMPGQEFPVGPAQLDHPITDTEWPTLMDKSCWIYVYAYAKYCDIFGYQHYRHFCGQWMPQPNGAPAFSMCSTYNDGDEDHPDEKPPRCVTHP